MFDFGGCLLAALFGSCFLMLTTKTDQTHRDVGDRSPRPGIVIETQGAEDNVYGVPVGDANDESAQLLQRPLLPEQRESQLSQGGDVDSDDETLVLLNHDESARRVE